MKNKGQFKKGYTWRARRPFWDKDWLKKEYATKSAADIAKEQNCHENNILFWLSKHKIKTRTIAEARKIKHWGASGNKNPMFGKLGRLNPRWDGGHSPERQSAYARYFWKELAKSILKRDDYRCRKCGAGHSGKNTLEVHHIKPWSRFPGLRFEPNNLLTVCKECHKKIHSRKEQVGQAT
jgi:5-methylcytosine-specific restriction endonuclease McrA